MCSNITGDKEFNQNHTYRSTPSLSELVQLENKVHQRLYLPKKVSSEHLILDLSISSDKLADKVVQYFAGKDIKRIVLKHPNLAEGNGNIFLDNLDDQQSIKEGIEQLRTIDGVRSNQPKYLLAEEQKIFPRISRKTEEKKDGYLTFRIVGITTREGILGYFIATKSLSEKVNSHKRTEMKCAFGNEYEIVRHDESGNQWRTIYVGPKDKYFNISERRILINENTMQEVFKSAYHLYHDIKSHSKEDFQEHIAECIKAHNNEENYSPFMDSEFQKLELVEKNDFTALLSVHQARYLPLRNKIKDNINYKSVNLHAAYTMFNDMINPNNYLHTASSMYQVNFDKYSNFILKKMLYAIEKQNAFDVSELLIINENVEIDVLLNIAEKKEYSNVLGYLIKRKGIDQNFKIEETTQQGVDPNPMLGKLVEVKSIVDITHNKAAKRYER